MIPEEEAAPYPTRRPLEAGPAQEPIGIILHRDGIIVDLNAETAALFGYERHEVIGLSLEKLIKQWDSPTMDGSHPGELKAIHKNGTIFTLQQM
jgi:PAS domain S-box-containing protein